MHKIQQLLVQWIKVVNTLQIYILNIKLSENWSFVLNALHKSDPNLDGVRKFLIYEKKIV